MAESKTKQTIWTRPLLVRLGKITDVAGPGGIGGEGGPNGKS